MDTQLKHEVFRDTSSLQITQNAFIRALCNFDATHLAALKPELQYEFQTKAEFTTAVEQEIKDLQACYPHGLYAKESAAVHSHPNSPAFSFYNKANDACVFIYLIARDMDAIAIHPCECEPIAEMA